MTVYHGGVPALLPGTNTLIVGGEGQVYAIDDLERATPLPIVDLGGNAMGTIRSGGIGVIDVFGVPDGHSKVVWVTGQYEFILKSYDALEDRVIAAENKATEAAVAAADAAAGAVTDAKVAAIVNTTDSSTAAAIKALAGSPVLILEAGEEVPPETPAGTVIFRLGEAGPTIYGQDGFERTLAVGWGVADLGGTWVHSEASAFRVQAGAGIWNAPAANTRAAWLPDVAPENADIEALITTSAVDHAQLVRLHLRRTASDAGYQAALYIRAASPGAVAMKLDANGTEIQGYSADLITDYDPGDLLRMRLRVQTVAPGQTSVQARVWKDGTTEPTTWHRSVTDTTAGLQANGGFAGVSGYTGGATVTPVEVSVLDLQVLEAV